MRGRVRGGDVMAGISNTQAGHGAAGVRGAMAGISDRMRNILILGGGTLASGGMWLLSRLFGETWHCPFKMATGLPCPGCGGLRAFELLTHGRVWDALCLNPLSVALMAFFAVSGVWLAVDIVRGSRSWLDFCGRPWTKTATIAAVVLLLANWVWNIQKGL